MWPAETRAGARSRAAGISLLEVLLAVSVLAVLVVVVERSTEAAHRAERYIHAMRLVTDRGQREAYGVFHLASTSRKVFQEDAVGRGYLEALDLSAAPLRAGARLPFIDDGGALGIDSPGDPRTGNVLLLVQEGDPAPCLADPDLDRVLVIDTYRFVCVHPVQTARRLIVTKGPAVDLAVFRSVCYPSYPQIQGIEDPAARLRVARDLYERFGHRYAWDPGEGVASAFYAIDVLGNLSPLPTNPMTIERDPGRSSPGRLVYANMQLAPTDPASAARRSVLTADPPDDWVPDGFEVKVAGPSGARKVWIHLVVEMPTGTGRIAVHASTLTASTRDM